MLRARDLGRLRAALDSVHHADQRGRAGWALPQLQLRIEGLDERKHATLDDVTADLRPLVDSLVTAAQSRSLDSTEVRELSTLCRRLEITIEQLLTTAGCRLKDDELSITYARADLALFLTEAREELAELASSRGLELSISMPPRLVADIDQPKIELALAVLLFNAFKHAPAGGFVCIDAAPDPGHDEIVIGIEDDGPALPPAHIEELFDRNRETDRNVSLHLPERRVSLGLARDLVGLHGGRIDVVLPARGNLRFELRLPRRAPSTAILEPALPPSTLLRTIAERAAAELQEEDQLEERPVAQDSRPLALVIVGSRSLHRVIVNALEPEHATASALDRTTGLAMTRSLCPALVIVDLDLSAVQGDSLPPIPNDDPGPAILAITSSVKQMSALRMLEAGVHDVVRKPLLLEELRARAHRLLATKETQDVLGETLGQKDTDLLALANEVAETHHDLERANVELEAARQRAERMSQLKSNFLRIMSHELKTPVTAMKLQLSVLDSDPEVEHTPILDRGLERLARSTSRLLNLVNTVLEWARVEDGRCRPENESFDVLDLVEEVVAELESHARVRDLELDIETSMSTPRTMTNDRRLVRLVLVNLVERAISVSNDARIQLRIDGTAEETRIGVRDRGPRMSQEQIAEVFDPLKQTRDFHRLSGAGSGLGVYALRDIARAVSGEIQWVDEDDDQPGNLFVFHVPSVPPTRRVSPKRRSARAPSLRPR